MVNAFVLMKIVLFCDVDVQIVKLDKAEMSWTTGGHLNLRTFWRGINHFQPFMNINLRGES